MSKNVVANLNSLLQTRVSELQQLQQQASKVTAARQKLETQRTENAMVKDELAHLDSDATVYKLIGPALLEMEVDEAKMNVEKRLEFIGTESERLDNQIKDIEKKQETKYAEISRLQQSIQSRQ